MNKETQQGQVINLASHDHRITRLCRQALPHHHAVATYVDQALRAANASELVARIVCASLEQIEGPRACPRDQTELIDRCLDSDSVYSEAMTWLRQHDDAFVHLSLQIISDIIGARERVEQTKDLEEGQAPTTRTPLAIRSAGDAAVDFTIIFNRAYVMLRDVPPHTLEPREPTVPTWPKPWQPTSPRTCLSISTPPTAAAPPQ